MIANKVHAKNEAQSAGDESALTDRDYEKLAHLATLSVPELREYTPAEKVDPCETEHTPQPWRLQDGRSTVTVEQCNAVRCAAGDGHSYSEIAGMFSFLSDKTHARQHAVGECQHSDGVPAVESSRQPGPAGGKITEKDCQDLRRRWNREYFETYASAGRWMGRSRSAAYRHINGECSHD